MYHAIRPHRRLTKTDAQRYVQELTNIGAARRPSDLPRYPRDAMRNDLNRIGRDMYKALENYSEEIAATKKERMIRSGRTTTGTEELQTSEPLSENAQANAHEEILSAQFTVYGSLPPPSNLSEYEKILPGSSERILKMAENEQTSRHEWDNATLDGALKENARGQYLGAFLSIIFAVFAVILAMYGQEILASAFAVSGAVTGIFHFKSWRPK